MCKHPGHVTGRDGLIIRNDTQYMQPAAEKRLEAVAGHEGDPWDISV